MNIKNIDRIMLGLYAHAHTQIYIYMCVCVRRFGEDSRYLKLHIIYIYILIYFVSLKYANFARMLYLETNLRIYLE